MMDCVRWLPESTKRHGNSRVNARSDRFGTSHAVGKARGDGPRPLDLASPVWYVAVYARVLSWVHTRRRSGGRRLSFIAGRINEFVPPRLHQPNSNQSRASRPAFFLPGASIPGAPRARRRHADRTALRRPAGPRPRTRPPAGPDSRSPSRRIDSSSPGWNPGRARPGIAFVVPVPVRRSASAVRARKVGTPHGASGPTGRRTSVVWHRPPPRRTRGGLAPPVTS